jgi:hypothetical protein
VSGGWPAWALGVLLAVVLTVGLVALAAGALDEEESAL